MGSKSVLTSFFIVSSKSTYTILLGRDWIRANCCIPSTMHQCLIQWDGDEVEVGHVDHSIEISLATMSIWDVEDHEPHRVDQVLKMKHSDALGKADPCDQPQKIKCRILMTNVSYSGNNHKEARSSSRPYISCNVSDVNEYDKVTDLNDRLKLFLSHSLSNCSDLADD
jgi:hypothetical protein